LTELFVAGTPLSVEKMPDIPKEPDEHKLGEPRIWMKYIVVGKLFILPVMVLSTGGYFLDRLIGVAAGFSVLGLITGFCLGMWMLVRVEKALVREEVERSGRQVYHHDDDEDTPADSLDNEEPSSESGS